MQVKLGLMTRPYMDCPIDRAYEGIAKAGYRYTAFLGRHPGIEYYDYLERPAAETAAFRRRLEAHGLKAVTAWGGNPIEYGAEGLLRRIDRAKELDLEFIIVSSPYVSRSNPVKLSPGELRTRFLDAILPVLPRLEEAHVRLDVKPHMGYYGTGAGLFQLARDVGHPLVGVSYDPGNIHFYEGRTAVEDLPDVAPAVKSLCVKDYLKAPGSPRFPTPGRGEVDWSRIFATLSEAGFNGYALIEAMSEDSADALDQASVTTKHTLTRWIRDAGGEVEWGEGRGMGESKCDELTGA